MYSQNNNTSLKSQQLGCLLTYTFFIALYVYLFKWDQLVYEVNKPESNQSSKNVRMFYERQKLELNASFWLG